MNLLTTTEPAVGGEIACTRPAFPMTVSAYLDPAGTSGTAVVAGRLSESSPWRTICTFELSGASDIEMFLIEEPYLQLRAECTAIDASTITVEALG
jgi:hypothetical protein